MTIHRKSCRPRPGLVSEFLRRVSDYSDALRVLQSEVKSGAWERLSEDEMRIQIQLARLLNLTGASAYALRVIGNLPRQAKLRFASLVGGIYLSNYRYKEALDCYRFALDVPDSELDYQASTQLLAACDCLAGTGAFQDAIRQIDRIIQSVHEPLMQGIALQAKGEYLMRTGEVLEAARVLTSASQYFKADDQTVDHGLLHKWLGAVCCLTRDFAQSQRHLDLAIKYLYRHGFKPEGWLEVLFWKGKCEFEETGKIPEEWARLASLGFSHPVFADEIKKALSEDSPPLLGPSSLVVHPLKAHFDFDSDSFERKHEHGISIKLGLDLADRLVGTLVFWGSHGMPQFRSYELLWPDQLFSFNQFQKRIEQLVLRARQKGMEIRWRDAHLLLETLDVSALPPGNQPVPGKRFLKSRIEFKRQDVERYFGISTSKACLICNDWVGRGLIQQSSSLGRAVFYRVIS